MSTAFSFERRKNLKLQTIFLLVAAILQVPGYAATPAAPAPGSLPPVPHGVGRGPSLQGGPIPEPPRSGAKFDMTGHWVSLVTEDYQWRMITPPKGDFSSLPLTQAAVDKANAWDLAADNASSSQCKAFGAPAVMRLPGRLNISWQDDTTLKIETDAGQQTRLLRFGATPTKEDASWQGHSVAKWEKVIQSAGNADGGQGLGRVAPGPGGSLKVVTTQLRPGYLRKNGIPYSENAVLTEYFNRIEEPNGDAWLIVTSIVDDPVYLATPFITTTHFLKEANGAGWDPSPCYTDPPLREVPPVLDEAEGSGRGSSRDPRE